MASVAERPAEAGHLECNSVQGLESVLSRAFVEGADKIMHDVVGLALLDDGPQSFG
jgi:hypothetical protein